MPPGDGFDGLQVERDEVLGQTKGDLKSRMFRFEMLR